MFKENLCPLFSIQLSSFVFLRLGGGSEEQSVLDGGTPVGNTNNFLMLAACFSLPPKVSLHWTSTPPCGKSSGYLLWPHTVAVILLPSWHRNKEHAAEIFLGTWPSTREFSPWNIATTYGSEELPSSFLQDKVHLSLDSKDWEIWCPRVQLYTTNTLVIDLNRVHRTSRVRPAVLHCYALVSVVLITINQPNIRTLTANLKCRQSRFSSKSSNIILANICGYTVY